MVVSLERIFIKSILDLSVDDMHRAIHRSAPSGAKSYRFKLIESENPTIYINYYGDIVNDSFELDFFKYLNMAS